MKHGSVKLVVWAVSTQDIKYYFHYWNTSTLFNINDSHVHVLKTAKHIHHHLIEN